MRVLLVEPDYRRTKPLNSTSDETRWYPPLGLMKIARFHINRGDEVLFVRGCDKSVLPERTLFEIRKMWDRVYITTLFTFHFNKVIDTIKFYLKAVGGTASKIYVGGIMASLMAKDVYEETGIYPIKGTLTSARQIGFGTNTNIDALPPYYDILDPSLYATRDTYYGYATRGCTNSCQWCGVPKTEPEYVPYIDIKPMIKKMRKMYGDKANLLLMDNNVLASPNLAKIVDDLLKLGFGRGEITASPSPRQRIVDFNQGLDATHITPKVMELLAQLNIKPMRIAFDRLKEKRVYGRAVTLAKKHGITEFSNYMLYAFRDTPRDLFERLLVNIELNDRWIEENPQRVAGKIYSYPMRFAPIANNGSHENRSRDLVLAPPAEDIDWATSPRWTRRFVRNVEIMKGAAHGAISPTSSLARRTIGDTFQEFMANLYMPEELLRNRNKHEKKVYPYEQKRKQGTGLIEKFRVFIYDLVTQQDERFLFFHNAVSPNSMKVVRERLENTKDRELKKWLKLYVKEP